MACNCEHLNPNRYEIESRIACQNLVYAMGRLNITTPDWVIAGAKHIYGDRARMHELTVMLCDLCRNMTTQQQEEIIYNGRNANARQLAIWWGAHQEADRRRIAREQEEQILQRQRTEALSKLSETDKVALGLTVTK